jgi:hypothetical protein
MSLKTAYSVKPLKGQSLSVNSGNLSNVISSDTTFTKVIIPNVLSENGINGVTITDSTLINCIIGKGSATEAFFTLIHTSNDVEFLGLDPTQSVKYNSATGEFSVAGSLKVIGCSYLDNIEICKNYIRADNLNGDISILSNNIGSIFLKGGIFHTATTGNYSSIITNGSNTQIASGIVTLTSSSESLLLTSGKDSVINTLNGSIFLNTDTVNTTRNVLAIDYTIGNIQVSILNHLLRVGDVIALTSNLFNGNYTVGSVINSSQFIVGTSGSFTSSTFGSIKKTNNNDIFLNASRKILIPENIPLTFANTNNYIIQNSTSGLILTSLDNFTFNSGTRNSLVKIPETTYLQFGSTTGNYIRLNTTGNLSVRSVNDTTFSGTNVTFTDPILTIAKGTSSVTDVRDRGIEYNWFDSTTRTTKLGWFGYKSDTKLLSFIPDAVNTNEIITGSIGNFAINTVSATNMSLNPNGNININCGTITNARDIGGCSDNLHISSVNVNLDTSSRLNFSTNGNYISTNTNGNLLLNSVNNTRFSSSSFGSIVIPSGTKLSFDGTTTGNTSVLSSNGNLLLNGNTVLFSTGSLNIPTTVPLNIGANSIVGSNGSLNVNSNNSINLNSPFISLGGVLNYSIDRYTLQSGILNFKSPDLTKTVTLFKVMGPNFTSSGTIGNTGIRDGTIKYISCNLMEIGCIYTLQFPPRSLIAPNPLNINSQPSKIVFKRQGQSVSLVYNSIDLQWILLSCNAYIS